MRWEKTQGRYATGETLFVGFFALGEVHWGTRTQGEDAPPWDAHSVTGARKRRLEWDEAKAWVEEEARKFLKRAGLVEASEVKEQRKKLRRMSTLLAQACAGLDQDVADVLLSEGVAVLGGEEEA